MSRHYCCCPRLHKPCIRSCHQGNQQAHPWHEDGEQQRKDGKSKWTKDQLDVPFANTVAKFAVLNDSIVSESSSFGYKITIFLFLGCPLQQPRSVHPRSTPSCSPATVPAGRFSSIGGGAWWFV
jgi:hypothetical protein